MISLSELCQYLDKKLSASLATDVCINGMQIEGAPQISRIATAVSASLATVETAIALGVQALIVHHGLFWHGDSPVIAGVKRTKIALLLENNISLFAYHIPLDMHPEVGNNWKAAHDLGWQNLQPFGYWKGQAVGVKGSFPICSRTHFQKQLEEYYGHTAQCALGGPAEVTTAALISGGAYKHIAEAAAAGVDCFLTGSFDESGWYAAFEEKVNFYALGHSATERVGLKALGDHLAHQFTIEHQFIEDNNPW